MSWHREVLEQSVEHLVEHNSSALMATQWRRACADYLRATGDYYSLLSAQRAERDAGQKIIAELNRLHRDGRKTVKIADLVAVAKRAES